MWVNCGKLEINSPSCLSFLFPQFSDLSIFVAVVYTTSLTGDTGSQMVSSDQALISSRQEQSRYLTANLLFWLQTILFFLHFIFSVCNARSSWLILVWIIPRIIIQEIKIPNGAPKSQGTAFFFHQLLTNPHARCSTTDASLFSHLYLKFLTETRGLTAFCLLTDVLSCSQMM